MRRPTQRDLSGRAANASVRASRAIGAARPLLATLGVLALALALAGLGCAEANPLPSPGQDIWDPTGAGGDNGGEGVDPPAAYGAFIQRAQTYVSSLGAEETEGDVVIVGAPGAASAAGQVEMLVGDAETPVLLDVDEAQGFATVVAGATVDLEIKLKLIPTEEADAEADPVQADTLTLVVKQVGDKDSAREGDTPWSYWAGSEDDQDGDPTPVGVDPPEGFEPNDGAGAHVSPIAVTTPDADGNVHVSSESWGVTPFSVVLVLNLNTGRSFSGQADNEGALDIVLPATIGDQLKAFASNPDSPEATTESIALEVPAE